MPVAHVGPVRVSLAAGGAVDLVASEPRPDHPVPVVHIPADCWPNVVAAVVQLQAARRRELDRISAAEAWAAAHG